MLKIQMYLEILKKQNTWLPILKLLWVSHVAIKKIGKIFCDHFSTECIDHFHGLGQLPKEFTFSTLLIYFFKEI